jgi:RNA polymerase sigma factor (sigma-70 family)
VADTLDLALAIESQASVCARKFSGFTERDDLIQEGWVWALNNKKKVDEYAAHENVGAAIFWLNRDLSRMMETYARREKAAASGYEPEDDLYFSDALINLVLPSVLKDDPTPPVQAGERVANTSDPAEGGTWLATYLDVKQAWERADLTGNQRDLLEQYYFEEATQQEIATDLGTTQPTVNKRLKNARRKLIDQLGGPEPREYNTEHDQRPGVKRNMPGIASQVGE